MFRIWVFCFGLSEQGVSELMLRVHSIARGFGEFLVDPAATIMSTPDLTEKKPPGDRAPRDDNCPEMPNFRPCGFCTGAQYLRMVLVVCYHGAAQSLGALLDSPRQRVSNGSQRLSLIAATKGKSGEFARCSRRHGPALGLEANGERSREIAKLSSATRTGNANACGRFDNKPVSQSNREPR